MLHARSKVYLPPSQLPDHPSACCGTREFLLLYLYEIIFFLCVHVYLCVCVCVCVWGGGGGGGGGVTTSGNC